MSLLVPYDDYFCFSCFGGVYMCSCVYLCMYELEVDIGCLLSFSTFEIGSAIEPGGACQTGHQALGVELPLSF